MHVTLTHRTFLRSLQAALLIGASWSATRVLSPTFAQERGTNATVKAVSKSTVECKCENCGTACKSGSVCEACATKLTQTSSDGMARAAKSGRMMATNDMTMPNVSFVYTLDNDVERNGVAVYRRASDGSLMELVGSPFGAGGKGLTGGDIDEQGAIRVMGKYILAVNPGSDSIAVFEKTPRGLLHVEGSPFPSNGSTPLSLAVHGDLVYVANQAADFAKPKTEPNVTGFRMMKDGSLNPIPGSSVKFPKGQGPAQVELSANGRLLIVTAGFQVDGGEGSRIYAYHVDNSGMLKAGENSPIKPDGATGTVGFSTSPKGDRLYVSTFKNSGALTFAIDPQTARLAQMGMPSNNDQRAACWTALTKDGSTLYVGNFVSNSISVYDVMMDGKLTLLGSVPRRGATNKDTKDIALSPDGKFLYAVGSGERQISVFKIEPNRLLTELPIAHSPVVLKSGQNITGLAVD